MDVLYSKTHTLNFAIIWLISGMYSESDWTLLDLSKTCDADGTNGSSSSPRHTVIRCRYCLKPAWISGTTSGSLRIGKYKFFVSITSSLKENSSKWYYLYGTEKNFKRFQVHWKTSGCFDSLSVSKRLGAPSNSRHGMRKTLG